MKRRLPDKLNRHTPLSRNIWEAREQVIEDLIAHYGLTGRSELETLRGLVVALCADNIPAFTHSKNRSGPRRKVQDPHQVFLAVNAIRDVAKGYTIQVGDAALQRLVDMIGHDIRANRRRTGVSSICMRLAEDKRSPWHGEERESIRDNYYAAKKRNDAMAPSMRNLRAAADALIFGSTDKGPEVE